MKLKFMFVLMMILVMVGCTYQQKIFLDGKPIVDNVSYSYNSNTGISTQSVLIRKYQETEDDESYISNEYYAPIEYHEFKKSNTKGIVYSLSIDNTYYYKLIGQGFYYNMYQVIKIVNHKNKTLDKQRNLIYSGHLSFNTFAFDLPIERGDEVNCYYEFVDKDGNLVFKTLELNYKIK